MPKLPVADGRDVIKALQRIGFEVMRQRGSHVTLAKRGERTIVVVVPMHNPVAKGTLRAIIRDAGLSVDEFVTLLR